MVCMTGCCMGMELRASLELSESARGYLSVGDGCMFSNLFMYVCLLLYSITCAIHIGENIRI